MSLQYKPLSLVALATTAVLYGCGGDDSIEKTYVYDDTTKTGLWCPSPQIVQTVDADYHPLSAAEQAALKAAAMARDGAAFDEAAFNAYTYDYAGINLFEVLGLTLSEQARQATAKEEARAFKISQGQQDIFADEFDSWFDSWFASVPLTDYLGPSERLSKASRGNELSLTAANNSQEICYTPPAACPNYQIPDESGTFACITPLDNPLVDEQPAVSYMAPAGKAAIFYRSAQHIDNGDNTEVYKDLTIHAWNDPDCTSYQDESTTNWGQGKPSEGIDPIYGMYWTLDLLEAPDQCGNMIVYNKVSGAKRVSEADLRIPLANAGHLANLDKMSYLQDGIKVNNYDGKLYANQHPLLGAAAGGTKACGWGLELDGTGEVCVGQALAAQCPAGTIAVGEGQEEIASKCILQFDPAATTLYLRGGFNDWGTANQLSYANSKFRLNVSYGSHPESATPAEDGTVNYGFKVADANWSDATTFGAIKGGDTPGVGSEALLTAGNGVGQDMFVALKENTIYQYVLNATNPAAVTLKINEVPLAVFPVMSIDGEPVELEYSGAGQFSMRMSLAPDTYSISIADMDAGFAVGAGADATVTLNQPYPLVSGGSALSLTVTQQNEYDFILDLSAPDMPTLEVKPGKPLGNTAVFIRGSLNGWTAPASDEIVFDDASRSYSVIYGLEASDTAYQFKFASEDWSTVDMGYSAFDMSADADAIALTDVGGNIGIKVSKSSSYLFKLDFNTAKPVLKVTELPIYIRGGMNGWGEEHQLAFNATDADNTNEAGHTYVTGINLAADNVFFKVATADWSTVNLGAPTDDGLTVEVGQEVSLGATNGNLAIFPATAGEYNFSFDLVNKKLVVTGPN
ncbi:hypothetical protein MN202_18305 [Rheinheimera muenzenbergensis]|uniref:Pullulanase n=1 Tax=Rheinheimera muenzenbergensis TaxID=1193628 RepID=A0ABU8CB43_9GAMM